MTEDDPFDDLHAGGGVLMGGRSMLEHRSRLGALTHADRLYPELDAWYEPGNRWIRLGGAGGIGLARHDEHVRLSITGPGPGTRTATSGRQPLV